MAFFLITAAFTWVQLANPDYLAKIDSSSKFLLGLINDILDMSKIENGEMVLNEAPFACEEFKDSQQNSHQQAVQLNV